MVDLIALMGTLVDNRGKIQIPGIYDTVAQVTPEEKELYKPIDFDPVHIIYTSNLYMKDTTFTALMKYT